eukprot:Partr_v1_DN25262_c0_g1_i1_m16931 putative ectonucleotide pyrophosphatase phosphodiesterase
MLREENFELFPLDQPMMMQLKPPRSTKRNPKRLLILSLTNAALIAAIIILRLLQYGKHKPFVKKQIILVSIDGFRADYMDRTLITPHLSTLKNKGTMLPSFPSKTFPNHYTLVTGLHPSEHGIVSNSFLEPETGEIFHFWNSTIARKSKWWSGDPIWSRVVKNGGKSGAIFWPGSEADATPERNQPTEWLPYSLSSNYSTIQRMEKALEWLGGGMDIVLVYVSVVDEVGHAFGPDSKEVDVAISEVDAGIGYLLKSIPENVDLLIVSDHGMVQLDRNRIDLSQVLDKYRINIVENSPLGMIWPLNGNETVQIYSDLKALNIPEVDVYMRDVDVPEEYHYNNNSRISPLLIVPKSPHTLKLSASEVEMDAQVANHGYNNSIPEMRAIFLAQGPSINFAHDGEITLFDNTQLLDLMLSILF